MNTAKLPETLPSLAVIGVGGYAGFHHRTIQRLEERGYGRLIATCDPDAARLEDAAETFQFSERGVECLQDYQALIRQFGPQLSVCTVPTPIHLHAEMHAALVEAGVPCYLEKPPTLYLPEWRQMMETEKRAACDTAVGFNYILEPRRQALKARLINGEFGELQEVGFLGLWKRPLAYYARNDWAGKIFAGDIPVLDCPIGNAMAHFVHNLLYWAGTDTVWDWALPVTMEAELYRANDIENADTVFLRGTLENGCRFRLAASHACDEKAVQLEHVRTELAELEHDVHGASRLSWTSGKVETTELEEFPFLDHNIARYVDVVRGTEARPGTRLADTEAFIEFITLALLAGRTIHPVTETWIERDEDPLTCRIRDVESVCRTFMETGQFPSESGVPWGRPGGAMHCSDLEHLNLQASFLDLQKVSKAQIKP